MTMENRTRRQIHVGSLAVDPTIGPDVDPNSRHIAEISASYDRGKLGVFTVSERPDGALILLDGYSRRHIVLRCEDADAPVDCAVYTGLDHGHERFMRSQVNGYVYPYSDSDFTPRDSEGDCGEPIPVAVVISEDADLDDMSYTLTRVLRLATGRVLSVCVSRPVGSYFRSSSPMATVYLLNTDGLWNKLTDYAPLEWVSATPHPPTEDTATGGETDSGGQINSSANESDNAASDIGIDGDPDQSTAERMRQFVRNTLTPVVDELQRRATAMLAPAPQTGQNTLTSPAPE